MDIRQLKYFIAVAEKLSFTEAAKHLYVAQSAVSQQIFELERKIGVQLFIRNKRSVQLTHAGQTLLCESIGLVKKFDDVVGKTRQADRGIIGNLKIGYIGYGDRHILPLILRTFRSLYPSIAIDINRYHQGALIRALKQEELDLAITFAFGIQGGASPEGQAESPQLARTPVYKEHIGVVVPPDHWCANQKSVDLSRLASEAFIAQNRHESPQGFDKTFQICNAHGFTPNIVSEPNLIQTVLLLVESGLGIAILPLSLAEFSGPNLRFLPIEGDSIHIVDEVVATWKPSNINPALPHLIALLADHTTKKEPSL